jgi:hypothetical protein
VTTESLTVTDMAAQLESMMDDNGDFVETEESTEEVQGVTEDHVEDFEEAEEAEEESEDESEDDSEEESEEESEDESEEAEGDEGELFEIEIEGEAYEVNKEELVSGYLRNEQLLKRQAELEAEYQQKVDAAEEERAQLIQALQSVSLEQDVGLRKFQNVDWERLKAADPEGYKDALVAYTEAQRQAQLTKTKRDQLAGLHQQAQALKHEAYLKQQREVAKQLIPEASKEGFADSLIAYGKSIGFTEDDIRSIADAKALFILNQARLYSELQVKHKAAKEKVSKELPPVVRPGAPKTKSQEEGRRNKALRQRLNSTHDLRDAAAVLEAFV